MKIYIIPIIVVAFGFSSCASLNQSLKFEEDDVYFSNDFQHRLNKQALLMNENVAMPDSAWEYYNESYANSIRPSYAKRFDKFNTSDSSGNYVEENERDCDYIQNSSNNSNNNWMSYVSMGVGVGVGYGYNAYYTGYQPNYYRTSANYNRSYVSQQNTVSYPRSNEINLNRYSPGANSRILTPTTSPTRTTKPYINPNPAYKTGQTNQYNQTNRQYRTRGTGNSGTGFNNSRTGGGSYSPSGTVKGYQRR